MKEATVRIKIDKLLEAAGWRFFAAAVEMADKYAKFWLSPVALAKSLGNSAEELRELRELVVEHRDLFLEKWHELFGG